MTYFETIITLTYRRRSDGQTMAPSGIMRFGAKASRPTKGGFHDAPISRLRMAIFEIFRNEKAAS
jgi:hypothetical protein